MSPVSLIFHMKSTVNSCPQLSFVERRSFQRQNLSVYWGNQTIAYTVNSTRTVYVCVMMTEIQTIDCGHKDALLRSANIKKMCLTSLFFSFFITLSALFKKNLVFSSDSSSVVLSNLERFEGHGGESGQHEERKTGPREFRHDIYIQAIVSLLVNNKLELTCK